jgi:hypothetical protein
VSATTPAIQFVLYSEDRADANQDFTVLREVLLGMLKHLRADIKTNHVRITPVQPVRKDRICGSYWKVTAKATDPGAQQSRRNLIRDVATAIRLGRVVFFHIDADVIWSRRDACKHACEHWPRLCRDVQAVLAQHTPSNTPPGQPYPIEQALADIAILSDWEADLARLDEIDDIKDILTIRGSHNAELVQLKNGFPVAMLAELPGSYAATVDRLRHSEIVKRGLIDAAGRPF